MWVCPPSQIVCPPSQIVCLIEKLGKSNSVFMGNVSVWMYLLLSLSSACPPVLISCIYYGSSRSIFPASTMIHYLLFRPSDHPGWNSLASDAIHWTLTTYHMSMTVFPLSTFLNTLYISFHICLTRTLMCVLYLSCLAVKIRQLPFTSVLW